MLTSTTGLPAGASAARGSCELQARFAGTLDLAAAASDGVSVRVR